MLFRVSLYSLAVVITLIGLARLRSSRARQVLLLVVSYAVYVSWHWWFAIVLLLSTIVNFAIGRQLRKERSRLTLWVGIAFNIALLSTFKYLPELAHFSSLPQLQTFSRMVLPLGLSFWTFQAMSYLFDQYGGENLDPCLLEFALYMVFFPVVISGPICRLPEMLPQFRSQQRASGDDITRGLARIATGVLMMQIAQLLGKGIPGELGINEGFDSITRWSGSDVLCLACGYGLLLFLDFAGYSHIAIGMARILGITVPENFARPFTSTSPVEYWKRWHMSLSFWIRDYVYIPMALAGGKEWWAQLSLLVSMVIFGVWHRGTLLFVIFGAYQGTILVAHRQLQQLQRRLKLRPSGRVWSLLGWAATMLFMSLGWIFFRANSVAQAGAMLKAVLTSWRHAPHLLPASLYLLVLTLAAGYALVLLTFAGLDRWSEGRLQAEGLGGLMTRERWLWLLPIYGSALLFVSWIVTHTQTAAAAPFLYRFF